MQNNHNQPILIRDKNTWPVEVQDFLCAGKQLLLDYKIRDYEDDKIKRESKGSPFRADMIAEDNESVSAQIINEIYKKYDNKQQFLKYYDIFIENLEKILQKYSFLMVHYTRLTECEIKEILKNGLCLPNETFLLQRINKLLEQGLLTNDQAEQLKNCNSYTKQRAERENILCFASGDPFEGQTDCSKKADIIRMLRSWGGEALYCGNEERFIGQILRKIGIPCIIEAVVPGKFSRPLLEELRIQTFIDTYLEYNKATYNGENLYDIYRGYSLHTRNSLSNEDMKKIKITRIIRCDKEREEFIRFTGCDTWDEGLGLQYP